MNTSSIKKNSNDVIMSATRGQSAWVFGNISSSCNYLSSYACKGLENSSETKRGEFYRGPFKNSTDNIEWLVGISDGVGNFHFCQTNKGVWKFKFKIAQSNCNLRLLYHIKSLLGVGSVSVPNSKDNTAEFRILNIQHIIQYILPIFDRYPLLTSKHFNYILFREAILIFADPLKSKEQKDKLITDIKIKSESSMNYISPAWGIIGNTVNSVKDAMKVMSIYWLTGFTEVAGSFYLVKKDPQLLLHIFELTIKHEVIVLEAISMILQLNFIYNKTNNTGVVTGYKEIQYIVDFFHNKLKGMKSLEYRIWARSFTKKKKDFKYLTNIKNLMGNIRSIRQDKTFKQKIF